MEDYVVLADEVHELGILTLPPFFPIIRQKLLGVGDIAYRCVKPHIEHFAFCAFHRDRNAPVEVSGYGTRLETAVKPALDLAIDIGTPFLMAFENPLPEPLLIVLKREVPVGGFLLYRFGTAEFALRVDEFLRAESASALFALVTVCAFSSTLRTGSHNVAVCEEGFGFRVIVLLAFLCDEFAVVIEFFEELGGVFFVHFGRCSSVDVEVDAEAFETLVDYLVIFVNYVLRSAALLTRFDGDRHSVLVASADIQHFFTPHPEVAYIDVGRDIYSGQVSDMNRAVGIRQRAGYQCSLVVLSHNLKNQPQR